ncbi:hypothetical protein ABPG75_008535 [Micractinium tetrahymenae]
MQGLLEFCQAWKAHLKAPATTSDELESLPSLPQGWEKLHISPSGQQALRRELEDLGTLLQHLSAAQLSRLESAPRCDAGFVPPLLRQLDGACSLIKLMAQITNTDVGLPWLHSMAAACGGVLAAGEPLLRAACASAAAASMQLEGWACHQLFAVAFASRCFHEAIKLVEPAAERLGSAAFSGSVLQRWLLAAADCLDRSDKEGNSYGGFVNMLRYSLQDDRIMAAVEGNRAVQGKWLHLLLRMLHPPPGRPAASSWTLAAAAYCLVGMPPQAALEDHLRGPPGLRTMQAAAAAFSQLRSQAGASSNMDAARLQCGRLKCFAYLTARLLYPSTAGGGAPERAAVALRVLAEALPQVTWALEHWRAVMLGLAGSPSPQGREFGTEGVNGACFQLACAFKLAALATCGGAQQAKQAASMRSVQAGQQALLHMLRVLHQLYEIENPAAQLDRAAPPNRLLHSTSYARATQLLVLGDGTARAAGDFCSALASHLAEQCLQLAAAGDGSAGRGALLQVLWQAHAACASLAQSLPDSLPYSPPGGLGSIFLMDSSPHRQAVGDNPWAKLLAKGPPTSCLGCCQSSLAQALCSLMDGAAALCQWDQEGGAAALPELGRHLDSLLLAHLNLLHSAQQQLLGFTGADALLLLLRCPAGQHALFNFAGGPAMLALALARMCQALQQAHPPSALVAALAASPGLLHAARHNHEAAAAVASRGLLPRLLACAARCSNPEGGASAALLVHALLAGLLAAGQAASCEAASSGDSAANETAAAADQAHRQLATALAESAAEGLPSRAALKAARRLAVALEALWKAEHAQQPEHQAALRLRAAQAVALRPCANLGCPHLGSAAEGFRSKRCSVCMTARFCCAECSKQAWKAEVPPGGHRAACPLLREAGAIEGGG